MESRKAIVPRHSIRDIAIGFRATSKNYYIISWMGCKILFVLQDVGYCVSHLASDISFGLCLGALLNLENWYLIPILLLPAGPDLATSVIWLISDIQYPAQAVEDLGAELGYPCYGVSTEQWMATTVTGLGLNIRRYIFFATTALLFVIAIFTLVMRYRGHNGRLVNVLRRDGGLYYIALAGAVLPLKYHDFRSLLVCAKSSLKDVDEALRLMWSLKTNTVHFQLAVQILDLAHSVILPILAQRLMLNLRTADYMGSRPYASKLLFAPPPPGSEDDLDHDIVDSFEASREGCRLRNPRV
ncbi:hypothetical protein NMY22_g11317 [Coprinellus aureogranulatus]|nr:hypothetical protein NMY22_g11317 [Coprinellus aureogranulatus]